MTNLAVNTRFADNLSWMQSPDYLAEIEKLVTEDDVPVDNIFSEKQQRLLTEPLFSSWRPGRPFMALANVGLFFEIKQPPLVPDMLLSLDVRLPPDVWPKRHRSYFVWEYGKLPEAVIEVVSNKEGGESGAKLEKYADMGIRYYVVFDPEHQLSKTTLRVYRQEGDGYVETLERFFPDIGLGLKLWQGEYEDFEAEWLRWCDMDKYLIPTAVESREKESWRADSEARRADTEAQRAYAEAQRADSEAQRADTEAQRANVEAQRADAEARRAEDALWQVDAERRQREQLLVKLQALGIDPETLK